MKHILVALAFLFSLAFTSSIGAQSSPSGGQTYYYLELAGKPNKEKLYYSFFSAVRASSGSEDPTPQLKEAFLETVRREFASELVQYPVNEYDVIARKKTWDAGWPSEAEAQSVLDAKKKWLLNNKGKFWDVKF